MYEKGVPHGAYPFHAFDIYLSILSAIQATDDTIVPFYYSPFYSLLLLPSITPSYYSLLLLPFLLPSITPYLNSLFKFPF